MCSKTCREGHRKRCRRRVRTYNTPYQERVRNATEIQPIVKIGDINETSFLSHPVPVHLAPAIHGRRPKLVPAADDFAQRFAANEAAADQYAFNRILTRRAPHISATPTPRRLYPQLDHRHGLITIVPVARCVDVCEGEAGILATNVYRRGNRAAFARHRRMARGGEGTREAIQHFSTSLVRDWGGRQN